MLVDHDEGVDRDRSVDGGDDWIEVDLEDIRAIERERGDTDEEPARFDPAPPGVGQQCLGSRADRVVATKPEPEQAEFGLEGEVRRVELEDDRMPGERSRCFDAADGVAHGDSRRDGQPRVSKELEALAFAERSWRRRL